MATTDFDEWLGTVNLEDFEEVYSLYQCVSIGEDYAPFQCETDQNGQLFIKMDGFDLTLRLASEKARTYFLDSFEKKHCGELDMESWYGLQIALENDKS